MLDGSERLQLTFAPMRVHEPRWSPDGKQILFTDEPNDWPSKIFVVRADGGTPQQLMPGDHPNEVGAGTWLPDGNSIVFARTMGCPFWDAACYQENSSIYQLDLKSQYITKLPGSDAMYSAKVSRDGRYVTALSTNQNKVMLYDFQTERWSEFAQGNTSISWSHDSKFVYLVRKKEAQQELIRISVPNGRIERVLDLRDITLGGFWPDYISLLPDDSSLLMLDKSRPEIYRLELEFR
jgi:Tol biopolymer transport system component